MGLEASDPSHFGLVGAAMARNPHWAVVFANGKGEICFWNKGAEALFGHSAADAAGRRVDLVVPPDYRDMHWAGFNRAIGSAWRGADGWSEIEGLHKDGHLVALEVFLTPMLDDDGKVAGVLGMFRRPGPSGTDPSPEP
jgi:PAS domain S-box-containing protein